MIQFGCMYSFIYVFQEVKRHCIGLGEVLNKVISEIGDLKKMVCGQVGRTPLVDFIHINEADIPVQRAPHKTMLQLGHVLLGDALPEYCFGRAGKVPAIPNEIMEIILTKMHEAYGIFTVKEMAVITRKANSCNRSTRYV